VTFTVTNAVGSKWRAYVVAKNTGGLYALNTAVTCTGNWYGLANAAVAD
jgi:hypothetical protein